MALKALAAALAACLAAGSVLADDREAYNQRAAGADLEAFRALDLNGDRQLTPEEVRPDLNFGPRFDDADIDRNGLLTAGEMRDYLVRQYGEQGEAVARSLGEQSAQAPSPGQR